MFVTVMDTMETIMKKVTDVAAVSSQKVRELAESYHRQRTSASTVNQSLNGSAARELRAKLLTLTQQQTDDADSTDKIQQRQQLCSILGTLYDSDQCNEIIKDIESRLWFTYRREFTPIGGSGHTCDTGWGCMIRCGQMMLAHALVLMLLGRQWRWQQAGLRASGNNTETKNSATADESDSSATDDDDTEDDNNNGGECAIITPEDAAAAATLTNTEPLVYYEILARFLDNKNSCYSVQKIALQGEKEGKRCGDWFGPNTIAQVLRKLSHLDQHAAAAAAAAAAQIQSNDDDNGKCCKYCINICLDGILCINDVKLDCRKTAAETKPIDSTSATENNSWCPLILIIPLRLGLSELNMDYVHALKQCLSVENSLGILGGRPDHALWFIGYVGDELLYLDPHTTQPAASFDELITHNTAQFPDMTNIVHAHLTPEQDSSFHSPSFHLMPFVHMDPSIALGFYCQSERDFDELCTKLRESVLPRSHPALFEIYNTLPEEWRTTPTTIGTTNANSSRNSSGRYRTTSSASSCGGDSGDNNNNGGGANSGVSGAGGDSSSSNDPSAANGDDEFEILA